MRNTWYREITQQKIDKKMQCIVDYALKYPYSSVLNQYYSEFKNRYIYHTNTIEGNRITEYDTTYIIQSNMFLEGYSARENMEVLGSSKAWDYIIKKPELSFQTINEIHKRVLFFDVEHAGIYRKIAVHLGEKQMIAAEEIPEKMKTLFSVVYQQGDFFENIAKTHIEFENIHPFVDGNGRTGRMIINLQLINGGYLPINIKQNEAGKYYRCFRQYDIAKQKGIQEMYNLITKYEWEELNRLLDYIQKSDKIFDD